MQWIGTISTGTVRNQIRPGNSPSENGSWERACPTLSPIYKRSPARRVEGNLPGVQVCVIIRPPPFEFFHGEVKDPEPSPSPLVPGAEPDLPGDSWRERQHTDIAEIVREKIFIECIRVYLVPGLPDSHDAGGSRFEDEKIIREIRVRILLPPVSHPLRECFCFGNGCDRLFPRVIFVLGWRGVEEFLV